MLTVRVKINIASQTTPQIIPVVQGDTGRSILFEIADFVIPAQATATYFIKKPSGHAVYNSATIDRNTVLANLTAQSIAEVGENPGQVRIIKNDEVVTSFDFILDVEPFRGIDAIESTTEMNIFDKAVQQALEEIDGSLDSIVADEFSTSDSYLDGEYVLKDGVLYRFTADHAAGAWSTSDTEAITVGEALEELAGGGGGGAVQSVNGQTGTVVLDAGDLEYDDEETYTSGTVGKEISNLKGGLNDIQTATSGDIGKALSPKTVSGGKVTEWQYVATGGGGSVDPQDIAEAVDVWCDENITNPDSPPLDRSLTASSAAAPADIVGEIIEAHESKNLYNKDACNPADGHTYNSSGVYSESSKFATSGKIPCKAETQYIFSAGGARVKNVRYFKGEIGETFISGENVDDGPFTTPALCTFVAVQLFSASHTTEQYNAAIAVAQLEKGSIASPYEPFGYTHSVPLQAIEDGEKLSGLSSLVEEQSQINLYDKTLAVNGKYYYTDGSVQSSDDWAITGFIPVLPNTQYNISRDPDTPMELGGTVKMYDKNQAYVGNATLGNYIYDTLYAFVTGPTIRYIGVGLKLTSHTEQDFNDTIDTIMLCYGTQRPLTYSAYEAETVIPAERIGNAYQSNPDCFTGKKWLATGTSITWYDGKIYADGDDAGDLCRGYVGNVSRRKKLLVTNEGISGSTLGDVSQYSLINRYTTLDWANSDMATIEYGVNDLGQNVPVGTASDAAGTTTFAACLKTVIEYALTQNPRLCLVICTEPDVRGNNTNNNGNTLKDYSDVTLEIAAQYRLPVCDWYYHGGFNTLTKGTNKLTIEGTHPNNAGHMRMGAMLNQVFDSLFC